MLKLIVEKKNNLLVLVLFFICAWVTYPSSLSLINEWTKWDQALSHGFVCLVLFVFFIWQQDTLNKESHHVKKITLILLSINSILWCFALLGNLQLPGYVLALMNFAFLMVGFFGWPFAKSLLPVLGIFIFAIPVWSIFSELLVTISSDVVGAALGWFNLTLHIQDNQIMTPWGTIIIADGCSGLRYLTISLLLAYLLCLINRYQIKTTIMVFVIATALGLATNWLRIFAIVLIGYHTEMQHGLVRDHELFGWILFSCILFPALYFSPQLKPKLNPSVVHMAFSWPLIAAGLLGPIIYFLTPFGHTHNPINLSNLESALNVTSTHARVIKPDLALILPITGNHEKMGIELESVPIYLELITQTPRKKSDKIVPYLGRIYDDIYWKASEPINLQNGKLNVIENRSNQKKVLLMQKYQVGSFITYDYYHAKLLQIPAKLMNQSYFGFWVAQASCELNCEKEISAMKQLDLKWQL